jgi:succinate dehydrogenase / fumarate reductase cytochrome b subunit
MNNPKMSMQRPLSPHLQIYRLTLTMVMSGLHRITGAVLYFGTLLLVWWLIAASSSKNQFEIVNAFFSSWFGQLILLGYTWALLNHMLGGIRHFIWDMGHGFEPQGREFLARATLVGSTVLTVLIWVLGYVLKG